MSVLARAAQSLAKLPRRKDVGAHGLRNSEKQRLLAQTDDRRGAQAATLDEAAKGIGCNPAVLEKTVRQYNHSVHIGRDEAFGKTTTLKALDEPPFYYGEERLNIQTEGGAAIVTSRPAFWINPRSPSWVFLRPAKPSEIFMAKAAPAGTAFWPASSSAGSPAKKRLDLSLSSH